MTHWNLSCDVPPTSSNSKFLVSHTRLHEKNRFHGTHGTKCYHNYLESMESMNTTILWDNDTIRHCVFWICLICLNMIKFKFRWERESTAWVQGDCSLEKKDLETNDYFFGLGNMLCLYIWRIVRTKHKFDYLFFMREHAYTIS